jgi:hypothetical protein
VVNHPKSEAQSLQSGFEMVRSVNEERGLLDLLFVAEFAQEQQSELRGPGLKQPHVEEFVGLRIDGSVQPVSFVVDPNHCLVDRDLIRSSVASRL